MADLILDQQKLYIGGRDFSSDVMTIALRGGREAVDKTTLGVGARISRHGLRTGALEVEGLVALGADLSEEELRAGQDLADTPIIAACTTGLTGTKAYGFKATVGDYDGGGEVGANYTFRASARMTSGRMIRGTILHDAATARVATGSGTALQVGAATATQRIFACLQVVAASGTTPTLDVTISSDAAEDMASDTLRFTFAQVDAAGSSEWMELAGAVTDDWWQVTHTIGGTDPSFTYVLLLAILDA